MLQRNVIGICSCARSFGPFLTTTPVCTHKCAYLKKLNAIKLNANSLAPHYQKTPLILLVVHLLHLRDQHPKMR